MAPKQVRNIWPEPGVSKMAVRKVAIYSEISASMQIQAAVRFALETVAGLFWQSGDSHCCIEFFSLICYISSICRETSASQDFMASMVLAKSSSSSQPRRSAP